MDRARELCDIASRAADDKKARAIMRIDLTDVSVMCDHFVVCSAGSPAQVRAIADHILEQWALAGMNDIKQEGQQEASWVLLDCGLVVVHIMRDEVREFYALEQLWGKGRMEPWQAVSA
ncbi:MAG: ribosome silencing factor [Candidatus Sericytochromatia bacterium]|nr:ribosome silencing factor [Candidatus Sericytochromatia bacterium]